MKVFRRSVRPGDYAVIFTSTRRPGDDAAYGAMAGRMVELAAGQPGFVGIEAARGVDGFGATISYWESPEAIAKWKAHVEHQQAQARGREDWYAEFHLVIARVDRAREWKSAAL